MCKNFVSDSRGLVDFVIGLVDSVLYLPLIEQSIFFFLWGGGGGGGGGGRGASNYRRTVTNLTYLKINILQAS